MRIKLIIPKNSGFGLHNIPNFKTPPYGLMLLAASTPEKHEVKIVDENIEKLEFNEVPDLVGISTLTPNSTRAYEIADKFIKMGSKVVLGGVHPSLMPNESIKHANSVIIGEAEEIWKDIINDVEDQRFKKFYYGNFCQNLDGLPLPRRDLIKESSYIMSNVVQTGRGCPFGCDFCSVTKMFGRKFRHKSVKRVLEEINTFKGNFYFLDDNIGIDPKFSKKLFNRLIPFNRKWAAQASINIARDDELLKLASESGCTTLFIGFESVIQDNLRNIHKPHRVEDYKNLIKKIHDYNISIIGAFVFGFDGDKTSVFKETLDFIHESELDYIQFTALTPYPATPLFEKMKREKRIITYDWGKYDCLHVVFKPKNMSVQQLQNGLTWSYSEFYKISIKDLISFASNKRIKNILNFWFSSIKNPLKFSKFLYGMVRARKYIQKNLGLKNTSNRSEF